MRNQNSFKISYQHTKINDITKTSNNNNRKLGRKNLYQEKKYNSPRFKPSKPMQNLLKKSFNKIFEEHYQPKEVLLMLMLWSYMIKFRDTKISESQRKTAQ